MNTDPQIREHWLSHHHDGTFKSVEKFCWKFSQLESTETDLEMKVQYSPVSLHQLNGIEESACSSKALEFAIEQMRNRYMVGQSKVKLRVTMDS